MAYRPDRYEYNPYSPSEPDYLRDRYFVAPPNDPRLERMYLDDIQKTNHEMLRMVKVMYDRMIL